MSVKVMAMVWDHYPEGGGELLTALKLADHADHVGDRIWPGVASLARMTRQSERTIQRHLQAMLDNGWLVKVGAGGKGPADTTKYRMPIERIPQGIEGRVPNLHPSPAAPRVTPGTKKGDIHDKKGDTAMSPEPSLKATKSEPPVAGQGKPSPVPALFKTYQDGIRRLYGAEYPPSAKANGQLAQVAKTLGAERAAQALRYYLGSAKPYYATRKHALDVFVRDAADLCITVQQAAGGRVGPAPTEAIAYIEHSDGERARITEYPVGEPFEIAKTFAREYASKVNRQGVTSVMVRIGNRECRWKPEELR